jgi:CheY-like chemotaxis protein
MPLMIALHPVPNILIVEDDAGIRAAIAEAFEEGGYATVSVAHGREALNYLEMRDQLRHSLPSLILLDLFMTVMSGTTFLHAWRQSPSYRPEIPIVALTASTLDLPADAGVIATLRKPKDLTFDVLMKLARDHVGEPQA